MIMEYKYTDTYKKEIIDELLQIEKNKGLTPERIVENAKNKNSPLHNLFEWDDSIAAYQYRLQKARIIVNEIKVFIDNKEYYAFENIRVSSPTSNISNGNGELIMQQERVYKPIIEILSNEMMREQIIRSALGQLSYWEKQYEKYEELAPVVKIASRIRNKLEKQWSKKKK